MKLLTSPSFSSSSTSISYQSNACTTKRATISYLGEVLRRVLCTRRLPTHPSDQIMEDPNLADDGTDGRASDHMDRDSSTGIVARLMGLESFSKMNPIKAPTSVSRSRSMNFVGGWTEECGRKCNQHPSVKTSLSFCEIPTHLEQEYEEFFVLSFDKGNGSKELWSKQGRPEKGKMERCRTCTNGATEKNPCERCHPRGRNSTGPSDETDSVHIPDLMKSKRKNKGACRFDVRIKKVETEKSTSEDASPVSVLDFGEWIIDPEEATIASDDSTADDSSTRSRKMLSPELDSGEHSAACVGSSLSDDQRGHAREENSVSFRSWNKDFHPGIAGEMSKISEVQIMDLNWVSSRTTGQLGDDEGRGLGVEIGLQVLDHLLDELVEQLVGGAEEEHHNL